MKPWLFVALLLSTVLLFGQRTVAGRVVANDNGEGLIGAHIYLLSDWRNGAITGIDGEFTLSFDPGVKDSVIASFVGFEEKMVPLSEDMVIRLDPITIKGQEVVITTQPLVAEEFKYMKIRKLEIYTNPAAKADPILAVNALPSSTTTDESANISLRGSSPIETGTFLNNVPLYDAVRYSQLNGIGTFSIFNTSIIKEVTVFPGNPPLEYGNSTSGVISLTTDDQVLEDNVNSAIVSLANIGFSRGQKLSDNQSLKVFSNWQPSSAIKALNERSLEDIESFQSGDLGIYWYGGNKQIKWKILNYSIMEGYEFIFRHPSYRGIFDQSKKRSFLTSSIEFPMAKGIVNVNQNISYSNGDFNYSNVEFNVKKSDFYSNINYLLTKPKVSFKSGLSYDRRWSAVDGNFHEFTYALAESHPTIDVNEANQTNLLEGFVYARFFATENVAIGTGIRKNIPIQNQDNLMSAQVNLSYSNLPWTITVGSGRYYKIGILENDGEPFESKSDQVSVDIKYEQQDYQATLSVFGKDNEIDESSYQVAGMELFASYWLSSRFSGSVSLTWIDVNQQNESASQLDVGYFVRSSLSYQPGRMWTIESTFLMREGVPYEPVVDSEYNDALDVFEPFSSNQPSRLPGYSNVGLSVNKLLAISEKMNIVAFASINNLLDTENVRTLIYDADYMNSTPAFFSRRTAYIGAVINF